MTGYLQYEGYVLVKVADQRAAFQHVLIAERALGRPLPPSAQVHHVNGVKNDNRNENLVICPDDAYHRLLHVRQEALAESGHADWRRCGYCHRHDDPSRMILHSRGKVMVQLCHWTCRSEYHRKRTAAGKRRKSA